MSELIKLSVEELLKKFGMGKPTPGSGSAAAFQGMLSAQLLRTVIHITKSKIEYRQWLAELNKIESDIENRIYPELVHLFQLDSEQFGNLMKLENDIRKEQNSLNKDVPKKTLKDASIAVTVTPIAIANLCAELGDVALFLFDNGFQPVRGDSAVALNSMVATVAGCLSIINLNLLSLGDDDQTEKIRIETSLLKVRYLELSPKAEERLTILEKEAERNKAYHKELNTLSSGKWVGLNLSYVEIEELARRLQNTLWMYHDKITKQATPENPIEILKPQVALTKLLGYQYNELPTLGPHVVEGERFEIAGVIDKSKKTVAVSQAFPKETQNFTAAHELGHALLHQQTILHRDRALDGSNSSNTRELIELQADKFATYFLMPEKQVKGIFEQLFLTNKFVLNENTVFALNGGRLSAFKRKHKNIRGLSKFLASAEFYSDKSFKSMATLFQVSTEAMAIRLEELGLIEWTD